ncbi:mandelate racemase/muconate lactonizing enzyme family protein [Microbacterium sp. NPDC077184]|uniref:mandelate racemase/muconate lactonizing enzyme family protein n=1 Tax=Microbacterium sp. NPDC077184 TaxID=3154764 RepID=UPI00341BEFCB
MKISDITFIGLRSPLPAPAVFSWGSASERNVGLVRAQLDSGVEGWGETSVTFPLWSLEERAATVASLAPMFVGRTLDEPADIADVISAARVRTDRLRSLWSPVGISAALGAIEMALWDAYGKALETPVWQILGGTASEVPLYAVGFGGTPEQSAEAAASALADGFAKVKVRVGFDPDADEALVRTVSDRIGGGLLIDANMGWSRTEAQTMLRRLEPYDLGWLEEPLDRADLTGYAELREKATMPIAAGENCYSEEELIALATGGSIDVVMPDLARVGGLTAAIAGARAARESGRTYSTHHYASDIGFAAMLALCAVVGEPAPILRDISPWPLRTELLSDPLEISPGRALPYSGPGLSPSPRTPVLEEYRTL